MDQFYMRLPSNSSASYYPKNKTSSFVTKLPEEIQLSGRWEVGLQEMQYPVSWINVEQWLGNFDVNTTKIANIDSSLQSRYNLQLPAGHYSSPSKLAEKFTETCRMSFRDGLRDCIRLLYDVITAKFTIILTRGAEITFTKDFARMLGFDSRKILFSQMSTRPVDIQRGVYSLYVYCDICKETIIGDSKVSLLQIVPIRGEHGDYNCERYDFPTYTPLQRNTFSDIKIDILDDTSKKIPFLSGKSIITLHFRKRGIHLQ